MKNVQNVTCFSPPSLVHLSFITGPIFHKVFQHNLELEEDIVGNKSSGLF